jgi:hypothetical protein
MVFIKKVMSNNEVEALRIFRLLKPEQRIEMHSLVHLAYFAENSAKKTLGFESNTDCAFPIKPQEYSCKK